MCVPVCVCVSWTDCFAPAPPSPVAAQYCVVVIMMGSVLPVFLAAGHTHKRVPSLAGPERCVCVPVRAWRKRLCVILRTSFWAMHADCTSYCVRVQPITVHIGAPSLYIYLVSHSPPLAPLFHLCFRSPISPPRMTFLLSSDNFGALQLLDFTRGASPFLPLQIEAAALQKTTVHLRQTLSNT